MKKDAPADFPRAHPGVSNDCQTQSSLQPVGETILRDCGLRQLSWPLPWPPLVERSCTAADPGAQNEGPGAVPGEGHGAHAPACPGRGVAQPLLGRDAGPEGADGAVA